jgi:hypothetical protein
VANLIEARNLVNFRRTRTGATHFPTNRRLGQWLRFRPTYYRLNGPVPPFLRGQDSQPGETRAFQQTATLRFLRAVPGLVLIAAAFDKYEVVGRGKPMGVQMKMM